MSGSDDMLYHCPRCGYLMRGPNEEGEFDYEKAFWVSAFLDHFWGLLAGLRGKNYFRTECPRCGKSFTVKR